MVYNTMILVCLTICSDVIMVVSSDMMKHMAQCPSTSSEAQDGSERVVAVDAT